MNDFVPPKTLRCGWPLGCERMAQGYDHDHLWRATSQGKEYVKRYNAAYRSKQNG